MPEYLQFAGRLGHHAFVAVQAVIDLMRSAFGSISSEVMRHLQSMVSPLHAPSITGTGPSSSDQQLALAQETARHSEQRQLGTALANGFGALANLPPALGFSANQPSVPSISGSSTQATGGAIAANNDDNSAHYSMYIESEDPSQYESHADERAEMIEDTNEMALNVNSNNDEEEDEELMEVEDASDSQTIDNSKPNNSNFETVDSDETDNEPPEAMIVDVSNEQNQAGPSIVANPLPTLTRRSTRAAAARKINYFEAMETSEIEQQQQGTLQTASRKRKRSNGRSGESTANKRTRTVPAPTVAVEEADVSEDEDEEDSEPVTLRVIVRRLKCTVPGCKKMFPNKVQLDAHHLAKHAIEKYACKVKDCTESYASSGQLIEHRNSSHGDLEAWPCSLCDTITKSYNKLANHFGDIHQEGKFACSAHKCTFTGKTRKQVRNHQSKHRNRKHHCTFAGCTMSFYNKTELSRHLRAHLKQKPFACSGCSKTFTNKADRTVHERIHSGLKPYHCKWPECAHVFSSLSKAHGHVRTAHFGLPKSKKEQARRKIVDTRDAAEFIEKITSH